MDGLHPNNYTSTDVQLYPTPRTTFPPRICRRVGLAGKSTQGPDEHRVKIAIENPVESSSFCGNLPPDFWTRNCLSEIVKTT